jgi:hypothetical protein
MIRRVANCILVLALLLAPPAATAKSSKHSRRLLDRVVTACIAGRNRECANCDTEATIDACIARLRTECTNVLKPACKKKAKYCTLLTKDASQAAYLNSRHASLGRCRDLIADQVEDALPSATSTWSRTRWRTGALRGTTAAVTRVASIADPDTAQAVPSIRRMGCSPTGTPRTLRRSWCFGASRE